MAELEDKYFKGDLTVEELRELRRQVNATDDDTLGEAMRHRWMDGDLAEDDYTVATRPIWQRIETATRTAGQTGAAVRGSGCKRQLCFLCPFCFSPPIGSTGKRRCHRPVWPFSAPMPEAEPLSSCPMVRVWYSTSGRGFPIPRPISTALRAG